jgi:hypothetical protein
MATRRAYEHLGKTRKGGEPPDGQQGLF